MASQRHILVLSVVNGMRLALMLVLVIAVWQAHADLGAQKQFARAYHKVKLTLPLDQPPSNEESIEIARAMFGIELPPTVVKLNYDESLAERGLTTRHGLELAYEVSIGPQAFASWAVLGATLAHELEVHCKQDFIWIRVLDLLGLNGSHFAERSAYIHELRNAQRFNLTQSEWEQIYFTMNFFYPSQATLVTKLGSRLWDEDFKL